MTINKDILANYMTNESGFLFLINPFALLQGFCGYCYNWEPNMKACDHGIFLYEKLVFACSKYNDVSQ